MIYIQALIEYFRFKKLSKGRFPIFLTRKSFKAKDKTDYTPFDPHYIYHPAWAVRVLKKIKPKKHVDISSILSFSTQISAFIPTDYYDFRPAKVNLDNYKSGEANLLNLPFNSNSIESISCMHTVEHVGLGRYGDPIDPKGDIKAMKELQRVTKRGGSILFVVPVGRERVLFNSHRVYSYKSILEMFNECKLREFKAVLDDSSKGLVDATEEDIRKQSYACGCFWFVKM